MVTAIAPSRDEDLAISQTSNAVIPLVAAGFAVAKVAANQRTDVTAAIANGTGF